MFCIRNTWSSTKLASKPVSPSGLLPPRNLQGSTKQHKCRDCFNGIFEIGTKPAWVTEIGVGSIMKDCEFVMEKLKQGVVSEMANSLNVFNRYDSCSDHVLESRGECVRTFSILSAS